jgi:hypothetical protein
VQAYSKGVTGRHGALVGMNTGAAEGVPVSDRGSVGMRTGTTEGAEENTSGGARHTAVGTQKGSTLGGARAAIGTGEHGASVGTTTRALEGALVWDGASIGTILGGGGASASVCTSVLEDKDSTSDGRIVGGTEGADALLEATNEGMAAGGTKGSNAPMRLCKGVKERRGFWERISKGSWV